MYKRQAYEIDKFKLKHETRIPGSGTVDYINVPYDVTLIDGNVYRVDVVARDIQNANIAGGGIGFSAIGSGIGIHTRIIGSSNSHICDVFEYDSHPNGIRLFFRAGTHAMLDEVSIRPVIGYDDVGNNNDCSIDGFENQS